MKQQYTYPKGDYLSGFSENRDEPCSYELECQKMVIRVVQYFDKNNDLFEIIKLGGIYLDDDRLKPLINFMCKGGGQTGAMIDYTIRVGFAAKKMGWDKYIELIKNQKS